MVKRTTPSFSEDAVKEAILVYLHERRSKARGVDSAKAGVMDIRRALKQNGIEQAQVIRNLLYLIEYRWVREDVEQGQIRRGGGLFPTTSRKYIITNQGMEQFDEKSKFSRPEGVAGININNVSGVVNVGDNNIIRNESVQLHKDLDVLDNHIRMTDKLNDEQKLSYRAEVKTIQSQLAKPNPDRTILSKAWSVLKGAATIASLASFVEKARPAIEAIIGSV